MEEIWKDIPDYNGRYQISNYGRIKSFAQDKIKGKIKNGSITQKGYLTYLLYDNNGNKKQAPVHRIVATIFLDNPDHLPQVNHKDEDKTNNHIDNLEWCTNEYNSHYGTRSERAALSNRCCKTTSSAVYSVDDNGYIEYYNSIGEAERKTGLNHSNIVSTLKGKRHKCGNKQWFYNFK